MKSKKLLIIGILIALLGLGLIGSAVIVSNLSIEKSTESSKKEKKVKVPEGTPIRDDNLLEYSFSIDENTGNNICNITINREFEKDAKTVILSISDENGNVVGTLEQVLDDEIRKNKEFKIVVTSVPKQPNIVIKFTK